MLPIFIAIALAIGVYLGKNMGGQVQPSLFNNAEFTQNDKLQQIISYISSDYVDTVRSQEIVEETISEILHNLDPHSSYIKKQDYAEMNDPLEVEFDGIGVEFRIQGDTITVVQALAGGPSEELGIMAVDRMIAVSDRHLTRTTIDSC